MLNRISPTGTFEASETDHRFDLREVLSFVWRQWKFIAAVMGVVFLIGLVSLMRQTPLYTATSLVLLDRQREKAPGVEAILTDVNLDFAMVESQMAIIRSSVFLRRVVDKDRVAQNLRLTQCQQAVGRVKSLRQDPNVYRYNEKGDKVFLDTAARENAIAENNKLMRDLGCTPAIQP